MGMESFAEWDGRSWFVMRLDYGWDVPAHPLLGNHRLFPKGPGALDLELALGAWITNEINEEEPLQNGHAPVVWGAEALLDLSHRSRSNEFSRLSRAIGSKEGTVLCARFPRTFSMVLEAVRRERLLAGWAEMETSGETPPLYKRLNHDEPSYYLHLRLEWETGVARARATSVLPEAGGLMARDGEIRPATLAKHLGVTSGAARSYLVWMEGAGLARRVPNGAYALRHHGLRELFVSHKALAQDDNFSMASHKMSDWVEID